MSRVLFLWAVIFGIFAWPSSWIWSAEVSPKIPELVIYTYDTIIAPEGLGPAIFSIFEKKYGCRIRALASGDGAQIISRLELDAQRKKPTAQVVIGIDQPLWERAKPWIEPWGSWKPKDYLNIPAELKVGDGFLPYDYGALGLIADLQKLKQMQVKPPSDLKSLLKPEWKKNIILEDPRTSTPGLTFLLFTQAVLGQETGDFWKKFKSQWLTLTPGWDQAYGLFLKEEAPLVWSYITSQAYHEEHGDRNDSKRRYQAVLFKEGQPLQIEGAAWVKDSFRSQEERELAKKFLDFLISPEIQKIIPRKTWMFPVRKDVQLPESYSRLPKPNRLVPLSVGAKEVREALSKWNQAINHR